MSRYFTYEYSYLKTRTNAEKLYGNSRNMLLDKTVDCTGLCPWLDLSCLIYFIINCHKISGILIAV